MTDTGRCGTNAGYQRHLRAGEHSCDPCRSAALAYQQKHRAESAERRAKERAYNRARSRAAEQLINRHPAEFRDLFAAERAVCTPTTGDRA